MQLSRFVTATKTCPSYDEFIEFDPHMIPRVR